MKRMNRFFLFLIVLMLGGLGLAHSQDSKNIKFKLVFKDEGTGQEMDAQQFSDKYKLRELHEKLDPFFENSGGGSGNRSLFSYVFCVNFAYTDGDSFYQSKRYGIMRKNANKLPDPSATYDDIVMIQSVGVDGRHVVGEDVELKIDYQSNLPMLRMEGYDYPEISKVFVRLTGADPLSAGLAKFQPGGDGSLEKVWVLEQNVNLTPSYKLTTKEDAKVSYSDAVLQPFQHTLHWDNLSFKTKGDATVTVEVHVRRRSYYRLYFKGLDVSKVMDESKNFMAVGVYRDEYFWNLTQWNFRKLWAELKNPGNASNLFVRKEEENAYVEVAKNSILVWDASLGDKPTGSWGRIEGLNFRPPGVNTSITRQGVCMSGDILGWNGQSVSTVPSMLTVTYGSTHAGVKSFDVYTGSCGGTPVLSGGKVAANTVLYVKAEAEQGKRVTGVEVVYEGGSTGTMTATAGGENCFSISVNKSITAIRVNVETVVQCQVNYNKGDSQNLNDLKVYAGGCGGSGTPLASGAMVGAGVKIYVQPVYDANVYELQAVQVGVGGASVSLAKGAGDCYEHAVNGDVTSIVVALKRKAVPRHRVDFPVSDYEVTLKSGRVWDAVSETFKAHTGALTSGVSVEPGSVVVIRIPDARRDAWVRYGYSYSLGGVEETVHGVQPVGVREVTVNGDLSVSDLVTYYRVLYDFNTVPNAVARSTSLSVTGGAVKGYADGSSTVAVSYGTGGEGLVSGVYLPAGTSLTVSTTPENDFSLQSVMVEGELNGDQAAAVAGTSGSFTLNEGVKSIAVTIGSDLVKYKFGYEREVVVGSGSHVQLAKVIVYRDEQMTDELPNAQQEYLGGTTFWIRGSVPVGGKRLVRGFRLFEGAEERGVVQIPADRLLYQEGVASFKLEYNVSRIELIVEEGYRFSYNYRFSPKLGAAPVQQTVKYKTSAGTYEPLPGGDGVPGVGVDLILPKDLELRVEIGEGLPGYFQVVGFFNGGDRMFLAPRSKFTVVSAAERIYAFPLFQDIEDFAPICEDDGSIEIRVERPVYNGQVRLVKVDPPVGMDIITQFNEQQGKEFFSFPGGATLTFEITPEAGYRYVSLSNFGRMKMYEESQKPPRTTRFEQSYSFFDTDGKDRRNLLRFSFARVVDAGKMSGAYFLHVIDPPLAEMGSLAVTPDEGASLESLYRDALRRNQVYLVSGPGSQYRVIAQGTDAYALDHVLARWGADGAQSQLLRPDGTTGGIGFTYPEVLDEGTRTVMLSGIFTPQGERFRLEWPEVKGGRVKVTTLMGTELSSPAEVNRNEIVRVRVEVDADYELSGVDAVVDGVVVALERLSGGEYEYEYTVASDVQISVRLRALSTPGSGDEPGGSGGGENEDGSWDPVWVSAFEDLMVYPNPTGGELCVRGVSEAVGVALYDLTGRCLWRMGDEGSLGGEELRVSLQGYEPGVYLLELVAADGGRRVVRVGRY